MKQLAPLLAIIIIISACIWLYYAMKPDVVTIEPAGQAREVPTAPPLLPDNDQVVFADSSGEKTKAAVPDADDVAVAVTIEADPCTEDAGSCTETGQNGTGAGSKEPVRLLIDAPETRWFPEFSLIRSPIRIRTLIPGQADRVTAVHQRLPIVDVELLPVAGIGYNSGMTAVAGAAFVRLWMLHLGAGIEVSAVDRSVAPAALAIVQLRDHLYVGAAVTPGARIGATILYGF